MIYKVDWIQGQYVSTYFVVPKLKRAPEKWKPILNLKKLNKYVRHIQFQMKELKKVRKRFQKGFMCMGLDLNYAFLHVPMRPKVKKFIRFLWRGIIYLWKVLPFGVKCSPTWLNPFFVSSEARTSVSWPIWMILQIKQDVSARQYLRSM